MILRCIHNDPQQRSDISEIVDQLARMVRQSPASFSNRLDMLKHTEAVEEDKKSVKKEEEERNKIIWQNKEQILSLNFKKKFR